MSTKSNLRAVLTKLQAHGYTVKLDSFRRSDEDKKALEGWPYPRDVEPFERSPLDLQVTFAFDSETYTWLDWLRQSDSDSGEDWHSITINPDTSPLLDVEDWILASSSKSSALGWVLYMMNRVRAEPTYLMNSPSGSLHIFGSVGSIVQIDPISFQLVGTQCRSRTTRSLRNLRVSDPEWVIRKRLRKVEGLSSIFLDSQEKSIIDSKIDENRQCIDVNCSNLCSVLLDALQPHVVQVIHRAFAQELVAIYFGFDSWNTFRGLEKRRELAVHKPYRVSCTRVMQNGAEEYLEHKYYRSLVDGIVGFGDALNRNNNDRFINIHKWRGLGLDNTSKQPACGSVGQQDGRVSEVAQQLVELERVEAEEDYLLLAREMLASANLEFAMKEYFVTGANPLTRMKKIDTRMGIKSDDHLHLGPWVFSLDRNGDLPFISVERLVNVSKYKPEERFAVYQHKAAIVHREGEYWLASDWDLKPKFKLDGLSLQDVELLEMRFLERTHWIRGRNNDL